jgi:O-antigen/teichoic acid export membrane protein
MSAVSWISCKERPGKARLDKLRQLETQKGAGNKLVAVAARRRPVTLPWRHLRQLSRRLGWGISDQAMSSLTNFLLTIYVARSLGSAEFGAFSLAYMTYGFAINASRGLSVEPLLIRYSGTDLPTWRRATAGCTGTATIVGLAAGVCALAAAPLVGGTTGQAFLALGLTLPGLMLQDAWRYAFFAVGQGHHAFINDVIWAAIQIPLLVVLKMTGHANVFWFVLAWGAGAAVAAVVGAFQARTAPRLIRAADWLVRHRDLGPRYLIENTGGNAADTLRGYGTSSILGLAAVGDIQAANVTMGPFKILYFGISMITIPEAAQILRRSPRKLVLFCTAVAAGATMLALAWGAAMLVALPLGLGRLMLGTIWRPSYPLVLPTVIIVMAGCANAGASIGMHALGAARRSLRSTLFNSGLILTFALAGAAVAGPLGTLYGAGVASWLGMLVSWWQFGKALHDQGIIARWLPPHRSAGGHQEPRQPEPERAAPWEPEHQKPGIRQAP